MRQHKSKKYKYTIKTYENTELCTILHHSIENYDGELEFV